MGAHARGAVIDGIERIVCVAILELPLCHVLGKTFSRPMERLHRIDGGGTSRSASRRRNTERGSNAMSESIQNRCVYWLLSQEFHHDVVAGARDQALAVQNGERIANQDGMESQVTLRCLPHSSLSPPRCSTVLRTSHSST